jgi:DNA-binding NtrC family response regulator
MAERVIITTVDLEPAVRLRDAFEAEGYAVELLTPGEHIADVPDAVLLILTGGLDQKQARRLAREAAEHDQLPIIALVDSPAQATQELRFQLGASELAIKPMDPHDIVLVGRRLIERQHLRAVTGIVGETNEMREVLERVVQIAPVNSTVLITGESGTGKERIARGIHALSPRRHKPFIAANVAALPETLLESSRARSASAKATSSSPIAAHCSWMRSAKCRPRRRPSCCGCWKNGSSCGSAAKRRSMSTYACSPRPTRT